MEVCFSIRLMKHRLPYEYCDRKMRYIVIHTHRKNKWYGGVFTVLSKNILIFIFTQMDVVVEIKNKDKD